MTIAQIERRLAALERDMAKLKNGHASKPLWWNEIAGVFADDPLFEKAMQYGRQSPDPLDRTSRRQKPRKQSRRKAAR